MDQGSFGILVHNFLRLHNLALVAKHMKVKGLKQTFVDNSSDDSNNSEENDASTTY